MNHRYNIAEENKEHFVHFLKVAKSNISSKYCNLTEHEIFSKFLPLDTTLQNNTAFINESNIVDLTESDDETINNSTYRHQVTKPRDIDTNNVNLEDINPIVNDILHLIKENLQTEKCLSSTILNNLITSELEPTKIFNALSEQLNIEETLNFGISLTVVETPDESVISHYIKHLLIRKLFLEYSDQLQKLLNDFSIKFPELLLEQLSHDLLQQEFCPKVFLQFIDGLDTNFKHQLLRTFVTTCDKLGENHIPLIEIIMVHQTDYDTLSKLVRILSNSKDNYSTDKTFGRLLLDVIKCLGKNVALLEQPLKCIIGSHRSVWKTKLQKTFDDCLQETCVLSQSFGF